MQYGAEFVLAIIAMAMIARVIKSAIRARHGLPDDGPFTHHPDRGHNRSGAQGGEVEAPRRKTPACSTVSKPRKTGSPCSNAS